MTVYSVHTSRYLECVAAQSPHPRCHRQLLIVECHYLRGFIRVFLVFCFALVARVFTRPQYCYNRKKYVRPDGRSIVLSRGDSGVCCILASMSMPKGGWLCDVVIGRAILHLTFQHQVVCRFTHLLSINTIYRDTSLFRKQSRHEKKKKFYGMHATARHQWLFSNNQTTFNIICQSSLFGG